MAWISSSFSSRFFLPRNSPLPWATFYAHPQEASIASGYWLLGYQHPLHELISGHIHSQVHWNDSDNIGMCCLLIVTRDASNHRDEMSCLRGVAATAAINQSPQQIRLTLIDRNLRNPLKDSTYSKRLTYRYLNWLTQKMRARSKGVFYNSALDWDWVGIWV